jgi:hypothetical protein
MTNPNLDPNLRYFVSSQLVEGSFPEGYQVVVDLNMRGFGSQMVPEEEVY